MGDTNGHAVDGCFPEETSNGTSTGPKMLWKHPAPLSTPMFQFMVNVNQKYGLQLTSYDELHKWSTSHIGKFWGRVWQFVGIKAHTQPSKVSTSTP